MQLNPGTRLAHYQIVSLLGQGGMGEVYRAVDTRLSRDVALKILPTAVAEQRIHLERFEREAKSLAALDHHGIVTVFSVEEAEGTHFLTMQLVPGRTLRDVIPPDGFPPEQIYDLAIPLADALAAAHAKDIIHRDIKPSNVMVTDDGRVKVLDFGLARTSERSPVSEDDPTSARGPTRDGAIVGTMPYMSPEQVEAEPLGPESDVFSLGVVLYEMATGRRPFQGHTGAGLISSILRESPEPASRVRSGVPRELDALIGRCLEKEPSRRVTAAEVRDRLSALRNTARGKGREVSRPWIAAVLTVLLAAVIAVAWFAVKRSRDAAYVAESIPRIERLAQDGKFAEAFDLARDVERVGGAEAVPSTLREIFSLNIPVETTPPGAKISFRPYGREGAWTALGTAPLANAHVPRGPLQWRAEAPGHQTAEFITTDAEGGVRLALLPDNASADDVVLIPPTETNLWTIGTVSLSRTVKLGSFVIDRHEVTNEEFARFVAAGGYSRPEFWKEPFDEGGTSLTFAEAMQRFRDATGRPGPSTWRLGSFVDGAEKLPVDGVSWYEAAAYARFAGMELPTVYHWYEADTAGDLQLLPGLTIPRANYESKGPRAGGGVAGAYGAIDMPGNVREWSANSSEGNTRLILGGAWSDPSYIYLIPELRSPFDRSAGNGFRCIRRMDAQPLPAEATAVLAKKQSIDYASMQPVNDETFEVFSRFFERPSVALDARVESTDESSKHWIKQKVSYAAGYDGERIIAWLYLPRSARPPYQVLIQMAGASTFYRSKSSERESDIFGWYYAESLIRGGRGVLIPVWKGSYERQDGFQPFQTDRATYRDHLIDWVTELRQSVDYLQSRNDVDPAAIGYQGISFGTVWGPVFLALEPRLKSGLLLLGGLLINQSTPDPMPPEMQGINYAPRVKTPVLMLSGRYDPIFPYETSQVPLYRWLGTPPEKKRHLTFPAGHSSYGWRDQLDRERLEWLDQQFGPVR